MTASATSSTTVTHEDANLSGWSWGGAPLSGWSWGGAPLSGWSWGGSKLD